MIVFKRFLYFSMIIYCVCISNVSWAQENDTQQVDALQKQVADLNEHINLQKKESEDLKQRVKNQAVCLPRGGAVRPKDETRDDQGGNDC